MRLRKKNISRVAAVAVAAVMAVSAAAPVAVAAAPAVNGGTAAVQENSERVIGISYKDNRTGKFIRTGTVMVPADATQITTDMLTDVPENWDVYSVGMPQNIDSNTKFVEIYLVPASAKRTVTVEYRDADNWNTVVGREEIEVAGDADYVGIDVLKNIPANWTVTADTTQVAVGVDTTSVAVTKAARKVTVEYRDADNWETVVGTEEIEVAGDADYVGTDVLTNVPAGWTVTADTTQIAVGVETTTVAVTKVTTPDPVVPTPTPDPEPTPAAPISPVATTIGLGAWLLVLGGLILGFFGL